MPMGKGYKKDSGKKKRERKITIDGGNKKKPKKGKY